MATRSGSSRFTPYLIISLLSLALLYLAVRQCDGDDREYAMIAEERARQSYLDSLAAAEAAERAAAAERREQEARAAALERARTTPPLGDTVLYVPPRQVVVERKTVLYSTIDGLNVRSGPGLRNGVVARLPLYAEVEFLNEVTDSLYEIDLGEITPREPWVRIRLADGKTGWVYGAGVEYYKYRLPGVIN